MALTKNMLGYYIEKVDCKNTQFEYGLDDVRGVSNEKKLMQTRADLMGRDLSKFSIINKNEFVYNHRTSRHGGKFCIAYNAENEPVICTEDYTIFRIKEECKEDLIEEWLYLFFCRPEFDRYVMYSSWGSSTEFFNWEDVQSIEIELPPYHIQQKYVDIYKALLANQQSYERGLDDLKTVCDGFVNNISNCRYERIGSFITRNQKRNQDKIFSKNDVKGFNNLGQFIEPMRLFSGDISTFKIITKGDFVYNSRINSTIERLSVALNEADDLIVSPAYESFYVNNTEEIEPYYLYMLLQRDSFARKVLFNSFGSSTVVFGIDDLGEIEIPVPDIKIQRSIVDVYRIFKVRSELNERLKDKVKDLCPILIKVSIEEARKEA